MNNLRRHVENLRTVLLSLPATGEKGFEGLVREALREITGVPFRLARGGSQHGIDGKSAYEEDAICFEGKRWDTRVPRIEVISKIADLSIRGTQVDIWVLGATRPIGTRLADDARELGGKQGVLVLILDWSTPDLPSLAVALAMGGARVEAFLDAHIDGEDRLREAKVALDVVRDSPDFISQADRIRAECDAPSVGMALAQKANSAWLCRTFSNRKAARIEFGQPLAPGDAGAAAIRERTALIDQLAPYLRDSTDQDVVFVLGGEGYGKSWLVAQSWLGLARKPLMLFLTPNDFADDTRRVDVDELLVASLIRETGETNNSTAIQNRWRRRLGQWRKYLVADEPRLIVVIDGIDQRFTRDWPLTIGRVSDVVGQLGGRLLVTVRTPYFRHRMERRLSPAYVEIPVPEWAESERDEILCRNGVSGAALQPRVARSLRNPRLLGIVLDLMGKDEISDLEELTVERLLFEHMRMREHDAPELQPAYEIARKLQEHAQGMISRAQAGQADDLGVFKDIQAVADGRFFQAVQGDPTRYSLEDEGRTLALGFLVIDRLKAAHRNGRDLREELDAILEPIESLDDTAVVVLAALTVSAVDELFGTDETIIALIEGFASLQNPNQASFPAFASLAERQTQNFMDAARALCLSRRYQPNFDWIQEALIMASRDAHSWQIMVATVHSWLSTYSLSPDQGILRLPLPDQQQKVQDQREKNRTKIMEKLQSLSERERHLLQTMTEEEGNLSRLSKLAFLLLAGKPLAPSAQSLMKWSFSAALNPDHATPHKDFRHLVSLNRIDWLETREAVLRESAMLRDADVSRTGKWALVNILSATGHSDDAKKAQSFVENLTRDRPQYKGRRLVEKYCESDPCDPASEKPRNVAQTAREYSEIDVTKVSVAMGLTREGSFFAIARPGVARFEPDVGIAKHRELVADVLRRTGFPLRQGLFELRRHAALLTPRDAQGFVEKRNGLESNRATEGLSDDDAWIVSQYLLLLAFPFLSATEQATTILASEPDEEFLLELFRIAKPLSKHDLETLLESACVEDDERGQGLLLQLAFYSSAPLSTRTRESIAGLLKSKSDRARAFALGVIARSGDARLLCEVVQSDWKAASAGTYWESWFGSLALLEAASQGLIAHEDAVDRISTRVYGRAAALLDGDTARDIARRIDASINRIAGLDSEPVAPDIELQADPPSSWEPRLFTLNESPSDAKDLAQQMRLLSETQEAFQQRQQLSHDAFRRFEADLTQAEARIILDDLGLEGFAAVVAAADTSADRWYELFMNIADSKLPAVHNLILWLAHALAREDPNKAEKLFRRIRNCKPLVRITYGRPGIQLDAMACWAGAHNPVLQEHCFARLDEAATGQDLAIEVLAALRNNQQQSLAEYVEARLDKQEPAEVARGLMVAGLSDQSEFNDEVLARYDGDAGMIGEAQRAAKYAYERNAWARHWFGRMCEAEESADFWRYSVLFLKIVDGRFDAWSSDYVQNGTPIQVFGFFLDSILKNRFERWKNHRSKKLFGLDVPSPIFLQREFR
jgi:hypothetical protein